MKNSENCKSNIGKQYREFNCVAESVLAQPTFCIDATNETHLFIKSNQKMTARKKSIDRGEFDVSPVSNDLRLSPMEAMKMCV
jgi:hypothetical protein